MIVIRNLYLKYIREYFALFDVNLEIEKGQKVAFVGGEDSGKTTLLRVLAKLEKISSGEVYLKDISLKKISYKTDLSVGYVPVHPIFLKKKTVYENLKYILKERKFDKNQIDSKINQVLIDLNVERFRDTRVEDLSNFQKYLISFARLCLRDLDLILIDNIFDTLNEEEFALIKNVIEEWFSNKDDLTLILATSLESFANDLKLKKFYFKSGSMVESLNEDDLVKKTGQEKNLKEKKRIKKKF